MQSLCLDVKVLDINQEEIDLKQNFDDDDPMPSRDTSFSEEKTDDNTEYSDDDIREEGFTFDEDENDVESSEDFTDDEFSFDDEEDDELVIDDDNDLFDSFDIDDPSDED